MSQYFQIPELHSPVTC